MFIRHGSALNLNDELTEKNKFLELNSRNEKFYPSNNNLINLNSLMNSEKDVLEDCIKNENQPENYTINMKVNLKNFNKKSTALLNSRRSLITPTPSDKSNDILVISEEIYQKRISKV